MRPRTLQKGNKASTFGSLRSLPSLEDEKTGLTRSDSKASSIHEDVDIVSAKSGFLGTAALHYGEVQTTVGSVFRKKTQYLVLTESHLIRFRSQNKASEMFPSIPSTISRTTSRMSVANYAEIQMASYQDITQGIALEQVVAVYRLDDGRPFFTVEVSYLDDRTQRAASMQMQLSDPVEASAWIGIIRTTARRARSGHANALSRGTVDHVIRVLERDRDYDPDHFRVVQVVQRAAMKPAGRASSDDLTKLNSTICYLAIGLHKVHFVPLARTAIRASSASLPELDIHSAYGLVTLTAIHVQAEEDAFQLTFKAPLTPPLKVQLASSEASEVAIWLRYASEYLRPEYLRQPFVFDAPNNVEERLQSPPPSQEDYGSFDRTLMAYCSAYAVDASRICYTVDHGCEDAPRFQLLPPSAGKDYGAAELLAVLRSLRYNESFSTISFSGANLCSVRYMYDISATDVDSLTTRSGTPANLVGHHDLPVLCQEVRGLALKSRKLRRLDFSTCFPLLSQADEERDSCCILEALVPLCKKSLTNVDWIVLNGVLLADTDLNFLVDAASERRCHLRALEIGECGLSVHDIDVLLSTAAVQENTMEVINISGVQGRFSPELFQRQIGAFTHIRRLNLTRVQKTAGDEPLIPPEVLMTWRLEALHLSQTSLNEQTVDSISAYLASSKSTILRELHLDQCGLSGRDLAVFFRSMTQRPGKARSMHVSASENRLRLGISNLFTSIAQNYGPSSLTMRMLDFEKENHFRELVKALTTNTTLNRLDISRASLPYDASTDTCEALKTMFATNSTLEELDMSGEHAHLDATRFGIGLNIALRGLESNRALRILRIEHQSLGLQGATTLAEVIERNQCLQEIHCEHNDINLQCFTVLINALEKNESLQYLPSMDADREKSMEKVRREIGSMERSEAPKSPRAGALKKSLTGLTHRKHGHQRVVSASTAGSIDQQDIVMALTALNEKWSAQVSRLSKFLYRNYCLANGYDWGENEVDGDPEKRPDTAGSLQKVLDRVMLHAKTPPKSARADALGRKSSDRERSVFQLPED